MRPKNSLRLGGLFSQQVRNSHSWPKTTALTVPTVSFLHVLPAYRKGLSGFEDMESEYANYLALRSSEYQDSTALLQHEELCHESAKQSVDAILSVVDKVRDYTENSTADIVQLQWPEYSFLTAGAYPEHIFVNSIVAKLQEASHDWPEKLHVDISSTVVYVKDQKHSKLIGQKPTLMSDPESPLPVELNTSINLMAGGLPPVVYTKQTISLTNMIIDRATIPGHGPIVDGSKIPSNSVISKKLPDHREFIAVHALCLDAESRYAVPLHAMLMRAYEMGSTHKLRTVPGFTGVASDSIVLENLDGSPFRLVSQVDAVPSRCRVIIMSDDGKHIATEPESTIELDESDNRFRAKAVLAYPPVQMQFLTEHAEKEMQSLEEALEEQNTLNFSSRN